MYNSSFGEKFEQRNTGPISTVEIWQTQDKVLFYWNGQRRGGTFRIEAIHQAVVWAFGRFQGNLHDLPWDVPFLSAFQLDESEVYVYKRSQPLF